MPLVNTGVDHIIKLLFTPDTTAAVNYLGVGTNDAGNNPLRNTLSENAVFKQATTDLALTDVGMKLTYEAVFAGNEANFEWREWAISSSATATTPVVGRVSKFLGTKAAGQAWKLIVEIDLKALNNSKEG